MIIEDGVLKNVKSNDIVNETFIIPEGVTQIGHNAFSKCTNMTSINIPEGVKYIGAYAFSGCTNLTSINIPEGVTQIGHNAFYRCENLTSIDIPNGVTQIGDNAFSRCENMTSINIPNGVTQIGDNAFSRCENLTSINIPKGIKYIGAYAFSGCTNLTNINIPNGVTQIRDGAFSDCENLTNINIPNGVTQIGDNAFSGCTNLTSIDIPNGVTQIGDSAFFQCINLTNIHLPEGVTQIGDNAFFQCRNLTNIHLPEEVTQIGDSAFFQCRNLTSIHIPEGVTQIGDRAFYGCTNLTSISIPQELIQIGEKAFEECKNLTSINLPEKLTKKIRANLYNSGINIQKGREILFGTNLEKIEKIKEKVYFQKDGEYDERLMNDFYFKMLNSIGIDEIERMVEIPNLTQDEIQRYALEKDNAFQELYDTKFKINGDLGITIKILKQLQLSQKVQESTGNKNSLEMRLFKSLNEKLEDGYKGKLTDLISQILEEQHIEITPDYIRKIKELEKSENKALAKENLAQLGMKIKEALQTPTEQYPETIVPMQIEPIQAMVEDTIAEIFRENGYVDYETLQSMLGEKIGHAHAPYIVQRKEQIVNSIVNLLNDEEFNKVINHSCLEALKTTKEQIGGAWKYKLNKSLKELGYTFDNLPDTLSKEEIEKLTKALNIKEMETGAVAVVKEGAERKKAYQLLKEKGLPEIVTYKQIHDMFGNVEVQEEFPEKFRDFYKKHRKEFLTNPECIVRFGQIHNNFEQIINSPELKNIYNRGKLTIDAVLGYLKSRSYENQRPGDEELARLSKSVGQITTEEEFAHVQQIFDITRKRERTTIPPISITKTKYRGRMLNPDDVLNLFAGNITTCCQRFGDVGEGAMLLGSIEENGGIFVVEELDEQGKVKNIVGQSLTIRQRGEDGAYDRLTFDNIEIDDNVLRNLTDEEHAEILQIYKDAGKQAIEKDKKFLGNLLKKGRISQEQYDRLVLKEVIAGTGFNDLKGLNELPQAEIVVPDEAHYTYKSISGSSVHAWIDSAGGKAPNGSKGIPVMLATMNEQELAEIEARDQSRPDKDGTLKEVKPRNIPLWYGRVGKVQTFAKGQIPEEKIEQIKQIERTVYREKQQLLNANDVQNIEDIENTYDIQNAHIQIGSNNDWYLIYGEDKDSIDIQDLAVVGGIHSEKNESLKEETSKANTKLAITEASNEVYGILLKAAEEGKSIYCNATADTSLVNIQRMLKQGCIEVKTMDGRTVKYESGKGLVYKDGSPVEKRNWDENSDIQMVDLEIIPKVKELQEVKKKAERLLERAQELLRMSGTVKEEDLDELRNQIRKVENADDGR